MKSVGLRFIAGLRRNFLLRRKSGLRLRLFLVALAALLPATALLALSAWRQQHQLESEAKGQSLRVAQAMGAEIQRLLDFTSDLLAVLSETPYVQTGDAEGCARFLAGILSRRPEYQNIIVTGTDGYVWCGAAAFEPPVYLGDRAWFQQALAGSNPVVSDYQIGRITGKPQILVARPVLDPAGAAHGVISAPLDLEWLEAFAAQVEPRQAASLALIDSQGKVFLRYPPVEEAVGTDISATELFQAMLKIPKGTLAGIGLDGVQRIYGYTTLQPQGAANKLYIRVGIPAKSVYAGVWQAQMRAALLIILGMALALLAALISSEIMVLRPIKSLMEAIHRLENGELQARSGIPAGMGEISQLGQSFDRMAGALSIQQEARNQAEADLARQRDLWEGVAEMAPMGVALLDAGGKITYANARAAAILGVSRRQIKGRAYNAPPWRIASLEGGAFPDDQLPFVQVMRRGEPIFDVRHAIEWPDGKRVLLSINAAPLFPPASQPGALPSAAAELNASSSARQPEGVIAVIQDITAQEQDRRQLLRLNRALRLLSEINQALLRAEDETAFIQQTCRLAIEPGNYTFAWVGLGAPGQEPANLAAILPPIACAGQENGYLEKLQALSHDPHQPAPQAGSALQFDRLEPAEQALRSGQPAILNDLSALAGQTAWLQAAWLQAAIASGFRSAVAFPITLDGSAAGALALYWDQPAPYHPDEVRLIQEMAADLSYGIKFLRTRRELMDTLETLKQQTDLLNTILDNVPIMIYLVSPQGRLEYANRAYEKTVGWSAEEIQFEDLLPKLYPDPAELERVRQAIARAEGRWQDFRTWRKDGRTIDTSWMDVRLPDGRSIGIGQDITARKSAERELQRLNQELEQRVAERTQQLAEREALLRSLLDAAPQAVWFTDADGQVTYTNRLWSELTGLSQEELAADGWLRAVHPDDLAEVQQKWRAALQAGQEVHGECRLITPQGETRTFSLSATPVRDENGQVAFWVGVNADITERVRAEKALQAAVKELETFTYSVSHDLKAPLRGIEGYSRLLLDEHQAQLNEEGRQFLQNIRRAALQMGQLIDDLLSYSRLERRQFSRTRLDLELEVKTILAEFNHEIETHRVAVQIDLQCPFALGESEGLKLVLRNLIDNAIKFTQSIPQPRLIIGSRQEGQRCLLWVQDNGIGFDMRYHERIFEIFHRLQRAEDYPGTGIGLSIVRKAMQRMGGRTWAESQPGKGATFFLELPL